MTHSKLDHAKLVLESFTDEYKDLSDTWRSLDTKAQGTGTISGVFLAAAFAWLRQVPLAFSPQEKFFLTIALVLLILGVASSIWALVISETPYPPRGEKANDMLNDLIRVDVTEENSINFFKDMIELWKTTNNAIHLANTKKASRTKAGQFFLVSATAPLVVVCLMEIYSGASCPA